MIDKTYSLCEAVADISYIAGNKKYYSGDSRSDIAKFIEWAKEFERINKSVNWGVDDDKDYIESINEFALLKIKGC